MKIFDGVWDTGVLGAKNEKIKIVIKKNVFY